MKKTLVIAIIAVIIGAIFLSISTISQNEDSEVVGNEEQREVQPEGRNLTIQLDETMGFSAP